MVEVCCCPRESIHRTYGSNGQNAQASFPHRNQSFRYVKGTCKETIQRGSWITTKEKKQKTFKTFLHYYIHFSLKISTTVYLKPQLGPQFKTLRFNKQYASSSDCTVFLNGPSIRIHTIFVGSPGPQPWRQPQK